MTSDTVQKELTKAKRGLTYAKVLLQQSAALNGQKLMIDDILDNIAACLHAIENEDKFESTMNDVLGIK